MKKLFFILLVFIISYSSSCFAKTDRIYEIYFGYELPQNYVIIDENFESVAFFNNMGITKQDFLSGLKQSNTHRFIVDVEKMTNIAIGSRVINDANGRKILSNYFDVNKPQNPKMLESYKASVMRRYGVTPQDMKYLDLNGVRWSVHYFLVNNLFYIQYTTFQNNSSIQIAGTGSGTFSKQIKDTLQNMILSAKFFPPNAKGLEELNNYQCNELIFQSAM